MKYILILLLVLSSSSFANNFTYETVSAYAETHDRVIRWKDGTVTIWDETLLLQKYPEIIDTLSKNLNRVNLQLTKDKKNANILIEYVDMLPAPYQTGCGLSSPEMSVDGNHYAKNIIRIKKNNNLCMVKDEGQLLVLHELGHALGFAKHAHANDIMSNHDPSYAKENVSIETLQRFLKGLYSLTPGSEIPRALEMPQPDMNSLAWSNNKTIQDYQETKINTANYKNDNKYNQPVIKYKKIEKILSNGTVSWEFVEVDKKEEIKKKDGKFEIISPKNKFEIIGPR